MSNQVKYKQLIMNDVVLTASYVDEQWWLAVKHLCEALGIDFKYQFDAIKEDPILSQVCGIKIMVDKRNRRQEMFVLPEKYVYGWLFGIRSDSPALWQFKRKCYDLFFDYFENNNSNRDELDLFNQKPLLS